MKWLTRLAWRNLWRYPRRTVIILLAVAVGVWSMISLAAYLRGMLDQRMEDTIRNLVGHVQIHAPGYQHDPVIAHRFPEPEGELPQRLNRSDVVAWASRVRVPAVISSERESAGVTLVGIAPERERGLSFIGEGVSEGRYLDSPRDKGVLLGRELLERLETDLGKQVVIMSQNPENQVAERGFRVVGVFDTELAENEKQFVFAALETTQAMLEIPGEISQIALLAEDRHHLNSLMADLRQMTPEQAVRDWGEINPLARVMEETFQGFLYIWYVVVFVAMGFGLVNTLLMAIFERTRELGLFQALGMKPRWVVGQILLESLFLLLLGLLMGNALAWLTLWLSSGGLDLSHWSRGYEMLGFRSLIYPRFEWVDGLLANGFVLVLGLLASLYPAWRATRRVPVEAITRV